MVKKWGIRGLVTATIWIAVFAAMVIPSFVAAPISKVWDAASGDPIPERDFFAVAFPRSDLVELRDGEGNSCGPLSRAVLISLGEWASADPIEVFVSATEVCMAERSDLTLNASTTQVPLDESREFYRATFHPQTHAVRFFEHFTKDSGDHVVTTYMQDGDYFMSVYLATNDVISPEAIWRYNSKAAAFEMFMNHVAAVSAASVAVGGYWTVLLVRWFWLRSHPPEGPA